jgi:two-component system autoinducer 1 sensor kinase/phosphatase LuxN
VNDAKASSSYACPATNRRRVMPRKPVVLCVDDEWKSLEGRKMLLEEAACKVLVSTSGADALQLFASHRIDLVLLDYHMPGMNGDVVAEHMKAVQPDVPIALLSADEGLPDWALKWVDAFVSKSESPANLLRMVEHLLDLRFLFAPLDLTGGRGRRVA